jgi:uncharacterized protein YbjT (DUF2867 family)
MQDVDLPLTVLRPVHFMENFNASAVQQQLADGRLLMTLDADKELQLMSGEDIEFIAAIALDNQEDWVRRSIELAGEPLTMPQAAELFASAAGPLIEYQRRELQDLKQVDNQQYLTKIWLNERGYEADIDTLRSYHPSLMDLSHWIDMGYWDREREDTASVLRRS